MKEKKRLERLEQKTDPEEHKLVFLDNGRYFVPDDNFPDGERDITPEELDELMDHPLIIIEYIDMELLNP